MTTEDHLWELVAAQRQGILTTLKKDGRPQLSNVLYVVDGSERLLRISTTADRVKARNLARDPRASLHVSGEDFWHFAVVEATASLSEVAAVPGDEAARELLGVHSAFYGRVADKDAFFAEMVDNRRLVLRLRIERLYGLIASSGPRPQPHQDES